jgi:dUTP pyrophosphatase
MKVKIVNRSKNEIPNYGTSDSAGVDLRANISEAISLNSLERKLIPTGLYVELPKGTEAQIRPRSGMAYKHGISVLNSPGTIDADYRGEIKVLAVNLSREKYEIQPGERLAQMVLAKYEKFDWKEVKDLDQSERGEGGFGSTGKH